MPPNDSSKDGASEKFDDETKVKRDPHPDFTKVQASRPDWDSSYDWGFTKIKNPDWTWGEGANDKSGDSIPHVSIDPNAKGRPAVFNYKLLISGFIPRPIGFLSTRSKDGKSENLAPYSYSQVVNSDPPVFCVGFAGGFDSAKDSLRNLVETGECVINIISEHFIEAANACSIDLPFGTSEWAASGLTPLPCEVVKASRVKESIFSIECKLINTQEFESRIEPGKKTGVLGIVEGVRFWVREDAVNEDRNLIDPGILRPIARLGGISYARVMDPFEVQRPVMRKEMNEGRLTEEMLKPKVDSE